MINFIKQYTKLMQEYDKYFLMRRLIKIILTVSLSYITINLVNWLLIIFNLNITITIQLVYILLLFIILIVISGGLEYVTKRVEYANECFVKRFKNRMFDYFDKFSFEQFESATTREQIYTKQQYIDNMQWGLITPIESIVEQIANCLLVMAIIISFDFQVSLILLIGISVICSVYINKWYVMTNFKKAEHWGKLSNYNRAISKQFSSKNDRLKEAKLFPSTKQMRKLRRNYNKLFMNLRWEITKIDIKFETLQQIITGFTNALATIIVVNMYFRGIISLGEFTVVMLAFSKLAIGLITISKELSIINAASQFGDQITSIISLPEKMNSKEMFIETIEFVHVSFKYPGSDIYAVHNISVKLSLDETIALIGTNGSGKTTFVKLLLGIYKPTEGQILINGLDCNETTLLDNIAFIAQDSDLYKLTLRENLPASSDEVRNTVLHHVGMNDIIDKVDKLVGRDFDEDGLEFSGGQVQKLLVARAFLSNKQWLVADEPTSNVDPKSEDELIRLILDEKYFKSKIIVSHRLSVLHDVDNILVIDNGKLVENGSFKQLSQKKGVMYEQYQIFKSMYF